MKITIDTKEDSPGEIKNIIKMLSSLVGEKPLTNQPNIFEDSSPEVKPAASGNIFGNIFDSPKKEETLTGEKEEEPKIEEKEEVKEDMPSVQEYH